MTEKPGRVPIAIDSLIGSPGLFGLTPPRYFEMTVSAAAGVRDGLEITANEIKKLKNELYTIIANHSGQKFDKVWNDGDRDYWMTAEEAKKYGMIDEVLERKK